MIPSIHNEKFKTVLWYSVLSLLSLLKLFYGQCLKNARFIKSIWGSKLHYGNKKLSKTIWEKRALLPTVKNTSYWFLDSAIIHTIGISKSMVFNKLKLCIFIGESYFQVDITILKIYSASLQDKNFKITWLILHGT